MSILKTPTNHLHGKGSIPGQKSTSQQALDVLHSRLLSAEQEAEDLTQQLNGPGPDRTQQGSRSAHGLGDQKSVRFSENHKRSKRGDGEQHQNDAIAPFKARINNTDDGAQSYDGLVSRVFRMESVIQSLKLTITRVQAERDLGRKEKETATEKLANTSDAYNKELQRVGTELAHYKKKCGDDEEGRKEASSTIQRLQEALEESTNTQSSMGLELEQLRSSKAKVQRRTNELRDEVSREASLRLSLEESHNTLLVRVQEMEKIVESERSEIQALTANSMKLKTDNAQSQNDTEKEANLRKTMEIQLRTMTSELDNRQKKISSLEEDKQLLMTEMQKLHTKYTELNGQIERMEHVVEDKQSTYKQLQNENKQLFQAMKGAASQNAQLVSRYEQEIEIGIVGKADRIQMDESIKQLEDKLRNETREKVQAENKCTLLEKQISDLWSELREQEHALENKSEGVQLQVHKLELTVKQLEEEKKQTLQDKEQLLDQVQHTVTSMTEERERLETRLREAEVELKASAQGVGHLQEENRRLVERLVGLEETQSSQKHIEHTMADMLEQKNKLAYDKGRLLSRVEQLQSELQSLAHAQTDLTRATRTVSALDAKVSKLQSELSSSHITVQRLESQLKQSSQSGSRKDKDFDMAVKARNEAVKEAQKLLKHIEALESKEKQKEALLQQNVLDAREDNARMAATLEAVMQSHGQLQLTVEGLQLDLGRHDSEAAHLGEEKCSYENKCHKLQLEIEQLHCKIVSLEDIETTQVLPLRTSLKDCKEDNRNLAKNMETILRSTTELQTKLDEVQDKYDKKCHLVDKVKISRQQDEAQHKREMKTFEERLDNLQKQLAKEKKKSTKAANKEVSEVRKQLESALSKNGDLSRTNTELRHKMTELEYGVKEQKDKRLALRGQVDHLQRVREKQGHTITDLQSLKDQLTELEKGKNDYMKKTKEQSKMIQTFMTQIRSLQSELKALAQTHLDTSVVIQEQADSLTVERETAETLRRKYREAIQREQRLEELRQQTEDKLHEANNESMQMSSNLQDAHEWFKSKFDTLQEDVISAKRSRADVEQNGLESHRLLASEKKQAMEISEKAKDMIRASREMIGRLTDRAEVAHQQTEDHMWRLRRELEDERENARVLKQKLNSFQESSFRHTEELAKELDYLKTNSWTLSDT